MRFTESFTPLNVIQQKLARLSHAELHQSQQGKWNILQHLYHCWMVERGVLAYIKLKTQDPTALVDVLVQTRLKFTIFFIALRLGVLKVKAPDVVQKFPNEMSSVDLLDKWKKTRQEADAFFVNLPDNFAQKGVFKHMYIGRLNKGLTQKFIRLHLRHHLRLGRL
tara:strand:+ start:8986 stop:9480 length:495 start_codon:yes stop_codon:yes gene_type:complete